MYFESLHIERFGRKRNAGFLKLCSANQNMSDGAFRQLVLEGSTDPELIWILKFNSTNARGSSLTVCRHHADRIVDRHLLRALLMATPSWETELSAGSYRGIFLSISLSLSLSLAHSISLTIFRTPTKIVQQKQKPRTFDTHREQTTTAGYQYTHSFTHDRRPFAWKWLITLLSSIGQKAQTDNKRRLLLL